MGWRKHFSDGTEIAYTDADLAAHKGSWSKERLSNMTGASADIGGRYVAITGHGEYWQSDDMDLVVGVDGQGDLRVRRIEKKIEVGDKFLQVLRTDHSVMIRVIDVFKDPGTLFLASSVEQIPPDKEGWWLILEYSKDTDKFKYYYSQYKV